MTIVTSIFIISMSAIDFDSGDDIMPGRGSRR